MSFSDTQINGILQGQKLQLENQLSQANNQIIQLQNQYDTDFYNFRHDTTLWKDPNHAQDNASQDPRYLAGYQHLDTLQNQINNLKSSIPTIQSQLDSVNFQIQGQQVSQTQARQNIITPSPVIPPVTVENPPPQVNRDLTITDTISQNTIPAPSVEPPPIMARDTNISTPNTSIFSSAKPFVIIGVALFAATSLFLTPKASKRK